MPNNAIQLPKCWALLPNLLRHKLPPLAENSNKLIMNKMNKFVLWLYVIGTVIIIKGLFRGGLIDGFPVILIGVGCIVAAYYIGKYAKRF